MENKQFPYYIEDWILWLGKKRDRLGNEVDFPYYMKWPVKLANYDVTFVVRSCEAIEKGIGFTDRQIDMAIKIVTKYQRQITAQLSRDVAYLAVKKPVRLEIRKVDRRYLIESVDDTYRVKFPYQPSLVDAMYKLANDAAGDYRYDAKNRTWIIEKTENNLVLLHKFVKRNLTCNWVFDKTVNDHFATVDNVCSNEYEYIPYLDIASNNKLCVFNSNQYLDAALTKFDFSDSLVNAAFRADNYGLGIGPRLTEYVRDNYLDISQAVLRPQSEANKSNLQVHLKASNLKTFMTTIRAKYWVFLTHGSKSYLTSELIDDNIPGEKLDIYASRMLMSNLIVNQLKNLNTSEIVVFSNNSILTSRVQHMLASIPMLRTIHLHGD